MRHPGHRQGAALPAIRRRAGEHDQSRRERARRIVEDERQAGGALRLDQIAEARRARGGEVRPDNDGALAL